MKAQDDTARALRALAELGARAALMLRRPKAANIGTGEPTSDQTIEKFRELREMARQAGALECALNAAAGEWLDLGAQVASQELLREGDQ